MSFTRAHLVRSALRRIFLTGLLVPPLAACGAGGPSTAGDGGAADGGSSGIVTSACTTVGALPEKGNCGWSVDIAHFDACGFRDSSSDGVGPYLGSEEQCKRLCGYEETFCTAYRFDQREPTFINCGKGCEGRRYEGLDEDGAPIATDVPTALARIAFFEAASVDAFAILARDLARHGAPPSLVRSCLIARADEVAHARMARTIARRHGAVTATPMRTPRARRARTLEAIAVENAVEGCVRETFGVVVGMWQAVHAPTRQLRAFFSKLADDEARHAALAWRVDAWARTRLDRDACARADAARARAIDQLLAPIAAPPEGLGLPSAHQAATLARAFADTLQTAPCPSRRDDHRAPRAAKKARFAGPRSYRSRLGSA